MAQTLSATARTGRDNQRKYKAVNVNIANPYDFTTVLIFILLQATVLKENVSSLESCRFLVTKLKSWSSNLPVAAVGSSPKAAGRATKALHKRRLVAKLGKRPGLFVQSNVIWERFQRCAPPRSLPRTHPKRSINSMKLPLTAKQQLGRNSTSAEGNGWRINRRSKH